MQHDIRDEYRWLVHCCKTCSVPEYMLQQSVLWEQGLWKTYERLLSAVPFPLKGRVVVDFGCKYGHLLPLLLSKGSDEAIGIDIEDSYIDAGRSVFEQRYANIKFLKSGQGSIPLQPETVDLIVANEVISHINPFYLENFFRESARVLRRNGVLLISDGNNLENENCRKKLIALYEAWENGPDGVQTDRDQVAECYLNARRRMIGTHYTDLDPDRIDDLAQNTSGLFGELLIGAIDAYVKTGELIRRPYQRGVSPTYPGSSGAVMERGFYPQQVQVTLENYGLECRRVLIRPVFERAGLTGFLRDLFLYVRYQVESRLAPRRLGKRSEGFQVIGVKRRCAA